MTRMGPWQNFEQLREAEDRPRGSRVGTLMLASLGGACIVFACIAQSHRRAAPAARPNDALSELLARSKEVAAPLELSGNDVTFPSLLSDDPRTTTALAAIRMNNGAGAAIDSAQADRLVRTTLPLPTDRLSVVPLPARSLMQASSLVDRPHDALTQLAKQASASSSPPAAAGHAGGYQLQASSFRTDSEANSFALALRQRGHHAYTEIAQVPGRGTWFRVRIGPFASKRDAVNYRAEFEDHEHLVPFVLDPAPP
jgi:DedD protein